MPSSAVLTKYGSLAGPAARVDKLAESQMPDKLAESQMPETPTGHPWAAQAALGAETTATGAFLATQASLGKSKQV